MCPGRNCPHSSLLPRPNDRRRIVKQSSLEGMMHLAELLRARIETEIQIENVHTGFTEDTELAGTCVLGDEVANRFFRQPSFLRDSWNLEFGCGGRNVRIKAGTRGSNQINGNG